MYQQSDFKIKIIFVSFHRLSLMYIKLVPVMYPLSFLLKMSITYFVEHALNKRSRRRTKIISMGTLNNHIIASVQAGIIFSLVERVYTVNSNL